MKKPQQLQLMKKDLRFFGGALLKGKRKNLRPLSSKDPIHIVMRSTFAKGNDSFLAQRNHAAISGKIASHVMGDQSFKPILI